MKKLILLWMMPVFLLLACASGGLYKSEPCGHLQGQAREDCMRYFPSNRPSAENRNNRKYLPNQDQYERALQAVDSLTEEGINHLFY